MIQPVKKIPLLILFIIGCRDNKTQEKKEIIVQEQSSDSLYVVNTETTFLDATTIALPTYFNSTNPVVFADTAAVYLKADSSSEIITKLVFNTPLAIENVNDYWTGWYQIRIGDKKGYIRCSDVAVHKFMNNPNYHYFLVTHYSPAYNPNRGGFTIYKYAIQDLHFVDTLSVVGHRADIAKELNHTAWKNVDFLLFTRQIEAYCGGGEEEHYLVDANHQFEELFSTYNYYDDSEEGGGSYADVKFPKNVATDTIVYHKYVENAVYNKKGKPLKNKDGSYRMKITQDTTKYYRWDGERLKTVAMRIAN